MERFGLGAARGLGGRVNSRCCVPTPTGSARLADLAACLRRLPERANFSRGVDRTLVDVAAALAGLARLARAIALAGSAEARSAFRPVDESRRSTCSVAHRSGSWSTPTLVWVPGQAPLATRRRFEQSVAEPRRLVPDIHLRMLSVLSTSRDDAPACCHSLPALTATPVTGEHVLGGELTIRRVGFGALWLGMSGRRFGFRRLTPLRSSGDEATMLVRTAVSLGVNFIDTADSYNNGLSERLIAQSLHPYPDDLVIATKGGMRGADVDGSPRHLRRACEESLRRLRREAIDLYQLHWVDPVVPIEESVAALQDLQWQGKIRHIGLSNVGLDEFQRARAVATIASVQNRYNVLRREGEDLIQVCEQNGIAFIAWGPLERGELSNEPRLRTIAAAHGATPIQVALAALLQHSRSIIAIPGTSSTAHLEENVAAANLRLTDPELAAMFLQ